MAEMMPQSALVPDSDYVIIGGTGDLALRKILHYSYLEHHLYQEIDM